MIRHVVKATTASGARRESPRHQPARRINHNDVTAVSLSSTTAKSNSTVAVKHYIDPNSSSASSSSCKDEEDDDDEEYVYNGREFSVEKRPSPKYVTAHNARRQSSPAVEVRRGGKPSPAAPLRCTDGDSSTTTATSSDTSFSSSGTTASSHHLELPSPGFRSNKQPSGKQKDDGVRSHHLKNAPRPEASASSSRRVTSPLTPRERDMMIYRMHQRLVRMHHRVKEDVEEQNRLPHETSSTRSSSSCSSSPSQQSPSQSESQSRSDDQQQFTPRGVDVWATPVEHEGDFSPLAHHHDSTRYGFADNKVQRGVDLHRSNDDDDDDDRDVNRWRYNPNHYRVTNHDDGRDANPKGQGLSYPHLPPPPSLYPHHHHHHHHGDDDYQHASGRPQVQLHQRNIRPVRTYESFSGSAADEVAAVERPSRRVFQGSYRDPEQHPYAEEHHRSVSPRVIEFTTIVPTGSSLCHSVSPQSSSSSCENEDRYRRYHEDEMSAKLGALRAARESRSSDGIATQTDSAVQAALAVAKQLLRVDSSLQTDCLILQAAAQPQPQMTKGSKEGECQTYRSESELSTADTQTSRGPVVHRSAPALVSTGTDADTSLLPPPPRTASVATSCDHQVIPSVTHATSTTDDRVEALMMMSRQQRTPSPRRANKMNPNTSTLPMGSPRFNLSPKLHSPNRTTPMKSPPQAKYEFHGNITPLGRKTPPREHHHTNSLLRAREIRDAIQPGGHHQSQQPACVDASQLLAEDKSIALKCVKYIVEGSDLRTAASFRSRIGFALKEAQHLHEWMLEHDAWGAIGVYSNETAADDLSEAGSASPVTRRCNRVAKLIQNAMTEVIRGPCKDWTSWFKGLSRRRVEDALFRMTAPKLDPGANASLLSADAPLGSDRGWTQISTLF